MKKFLHYIQSVTNYHSFVYFKDWVIWSKQNVGLRNNFPEHNQNPQIIKRTKLQFIVVVNGLIGNILNKYITSCVKCFVYLLKLKAKSEKFIWLHKFKIFNQKQLLWAIGFFTLKYGILCISILCIQCITILWNFEFVFVFTSCLYYT